ncbi:MAG: ABC transporter permease [Acidobacteria bacterium]|nr:ABC transporter permease [Acidobacteriota bacterium]
MADRRRSRHPVVELTLARFRILVREPEALFWAFVFPILMTVALGIAFRSAPAGVVPVAVVQDARAEDVVAALRHAPSVEVFTIGPAEVPATLRDGRAHLVVEPGTPPAYRYDPTRPESRLARLTVDGALQRAAGRSDLWAARDEPVVVPGGRYVDWLVPGLLGMNIMSTGMWGVGFSVVMQRSRKLLKRLVATPMLRSHYLIALVAARLAFLVLEVGVLVVFARYVFGVPLVGSLGALAAVSVLGAMAFGGVSLLTASRARTAEGVSGIMNVVQVPMWVCSGVFFASSNFPDAAQPIIQALPLTALIDALRGVMLNGDSLVALRGELGLLGGWTVASFAVALRIFSWR